MTETLPSKYYLHEMGEVFESLIGDSLAEATQKIKAALQKGEEIGHLEPGWAVEVLSPFRENGDFTSLTAYWTLVDLPKSRTGMRIDVARLSDPESAIEGIL